LFYADSVAAVRAEGLELIIKNRKGADQLLLIGL